MVLPALKMVTVFPLTSATAGVPLLYETGSPELAVAVKAYGASAVVLFGSALNVIVCGAWLISAESLHGLPSARYDAMALRAGFAAAQTEGDLGRLEVAMTKAFIIGALVFEGEGCSKNLLCKYHGWAFNSDGKLLSARDFGADAPAALTEVVSARLRSGCSSGRCRGA